MKIKTALILCAGYGKRLHPITKKVPKPLIKIKNKILLKNTINLAISLGIKDIKINTFYLEDKISEYVNTLNLPAKIKVISDGEKILDTGGGILNLVKHSLDKDFIILNPDTLWNLNYKKNIKAMVNFYFKNNIKNILLVVNKNKSFDKRLKGDFNLKKNNLSQKNSKKYIFTGCQIINRNVFKKNRSKVFSISIIWNELLNKNLLYGFESKLKFLHLTDIKIYRNLTKT
ncbi:MAG: nucleotidyltransferase [Candidatus Pelagibacter sp.]|nr:nucleotidyltransferase [Candidatus Pelagibacter sp.]